MGLLRLFSLLILASLSPALAADCLLLNHSQPNRFAGDYLEYAEISAIPLRAELTPATDRVFKKVPDPFASFGYTEKNYLLRFRLCTEESTAKVIVQIKGLYPEAQVWFLPDTCAAKTPPCKVVHATRMDAHRDALFTFDKPLVGHGSVYIAAMPPGSRRFPVHVFLPEAFVQSEQKFFWYTGLFFGALAAILLYNAALFLALRERINLYYALYLLLFVGLFLTLERIPEDTFGHSARPMYLFFRSAIFPLMLIPFALFNREFLQTRLSLWQNRFWTLLITADVILIVLNTFIAYRNMMVYNLWVVVIHCSFALAVTLQAAWGGFTPARIMLAGWVLFLISAILSSLHLMGRFPVGFNEYFPHFMKFGAVAENLLFTAALGVRVRFFKKQASEFAARLTRERENLAADLHDVLGSEFGEMQLRLHRAQVSREVRDWFAARARNMGSRIRDMVFLLQSDLSSATITEEMHSTFAMLSGIEGLKIETQIDSEIQRSDPFLLLDALRILQEWSGNCLKYGKPTEMKISLRKRDNKVRLVIVSNGKAFRWNGRSVLNGAGLPGIINRASHRQGRARSLVNRSGFTLFLCVLSEK